ncbi:M67 family metallopeptidase [Geoglobus sp.]
MRVFAKKEVVEFFRKVAENPGEIERCGLLSGRVGKTIEVIGAFELENVRSSPVEFELNPLETLEIFESVEKVGHEVVGVWHTHPRGKAVPSPKDVQGMKNFPGLWVIIAQGEIGWYLAGEKGFEKVEVSEVPRPGPSSSPSS